MKSQRIWVTAVAALLACLVGVIAAARPVESMAAAEPSAATDPALDSLRNRVAEIEALLGIQVREEGLATRETAYATLAARTEAIAARGQEALARIPSISPVENGTITSPYAAQRLHPVRKIVTPHFGLDIRADRGAPIRATADGVVRAVAESPTFGRTVDIEHGSGFITRYAHAQKILVSVGQSVRRGDTIALVGSTGLATGPHVHYEVFKDGWSVDPFRFLLAGDVEVAQ